MINMHIVCDKMEKNIELSVVTWYNVNTLTKEDSYG